MNHKNNDSILKSNNIISKRVSVNPLKNEVCFHQKDKEYLKKILASFKSNCESEEKLVSKYLSKKFINDFDSFPCDFLLEALTFQSKQEFQFNSENNECNKLNIIFNYLYKIEDEGEEYSSEKSFMLYFIKNDKKEILLDGFGVAG